MMILINYCVLIVLFFMMLILNKSLRKSSISHLSQIILKGENQLYTNVLGNISYN